MDGVQKPQCLIYSKVLGNGSLKPSTLKHHLKIAHAAHAPDDHAAFEVKRARFRAAGTLPNLGFESEKKPGLEAFDHLALWTAKAKKPHDIAERLMKHCALDMVGLVCGKLVCGGHDKRRMPQVCQDSSNGIWTSGSGFGASRGLLRGSLLTISKLSFRSLFVPF